MPAFHQIGHDSQNLLFEDSLSRFGGAILSPLNYNEAAITAQLEKLRARNNFVTIFDPHLYRPQSERMCLPEWDYYPKDVETSNFSEQWWGPIVDAVAKTGVGLGTTSVASPAIVPKSFPDDFFLQLVANGNRLETALRGTSVKPMQTVIAGLSDLTSPTRAMTIASIISRSRAPECLLVLLCAVEPRRELADPEELKGAMRLISALESGGQPVTVACCAADMILWKAAGATNCASGKYFNLRRFTLSRLDEPEENGGGGKANYWFEEALLCFLRQSDLLRIRERGFISEASNSNPFGAKILDAIPAKTPWLGFGWRQFLYWFADAEYRLSSGAVSAQELVAVADANWGVIETQIPKLFMEERPNDGSWVRQWLRAIVEFPYFR
jgi:hypothetical protein